MKNIFFHLQAKKTLRSFLVFLIITAWIFSGWPQIWRNPSIPPEILTTKAASPETFDYTGSTQYFNPANGIYAVTVECWGGGGGGSEKNNSGGGGGGGGAYAKSTGVAMAPGSSYDVVIGAGGSPNTAGSGGDSTFDTNVVVAKGGGNGSVNSETQGAGGLDTDCTGNAIRSSGGSGGLGDSGADSGGGGGGAGGPDGTGKDGQAGNYGSSGYGGNGGDGNNSVGTGTGGTGVSNNNGNPGGNDLTHGGGGGGGGDDGYYGGAGGVPGGGGGAGGDNEANGAAGGNGRCIISYADTWAPSTAQATYSNTWSFSTAPNNDAGGQISMEATTGYDYNTISYYFTYTACASDAGTGGTDSGWQSADTTYTDTGLQPNQCYGYTVQTKDSIEQTGTASAASETYTSANIPGQPTLSDATATTLILNNNENSNPALNPTTQFAVKVVTTSPEDATWLNQWVDADGSPSGSEVWLTDAQLDGLIIGNGTALASETTYGIQVKAKNENSNETDLSPEDQEATTAAAVVSISLDQETFDYGKVPNNNASSTLPLWSGAGITATNGNAEADFYIYGANSAGSGSGWTLSDNSTGNNYIHKYCNDTDNDCASPPTNYSALTTSPVLFKGTVTPAGTVVIQLEITTPTDPTDLSVQNAEVTVQASAP